MFKQDAMTTPVDESVQTIDPFLQGLGSNNQQDFTIGSSWVFYNQMRSPQQYISLATIAEEELRLVCTFSNNVLLMLWYVRNFKALSRAESDREEGAKIDTFRDPSLIFL